MTDVLTLPSQLNAILDAVCAVQMTVSGTDNALPYHPRDLSLLLGNFWTNQVRGGPSSLNGSHQQQIQDNILMRFHIRGTAEMDVSPANLQLRIMSWRDEVYNRFSKKIRLGGQLPFVMTAYISRWDYEPMHQEGTNTFPVMAYTLTVQEWFGQNIDQ